MENIFQKTSKEEPVRQRFKSDFKKPKKGIVITELKIKPHKKKIKKHLFDESVSESDNSDEYFNDIIEQNQYEFQGDEEKHQKDFKMALTITSIQFKDFKDENKKSYQQHKD